MRIGIQFFYWWGAGAQKATVVGSGGVVVGGAAVINRTLPVVEDGGYVYRKSRKPKQRVLPILQHIEIRGQGGLYVGGMARVQCERTHISSSVINIGGFARVRQCKTILARTQIQITGYGIIVYSLVDLRPVYEDEDDDWVVLELIAAFGDTPVIDRRLEDDDDDWLISEVA